MANSKAKGNAYEREFAEDISAIFGREFKRNLSGSGAHFGGGNFYRKKKGGDTSQVLNNLGDIVPPTGYYVVSECKSYNEFPFHTMLMGKESILWDWLEECRTDARMDDSKEEVFFPHWLSFKITRRGKYIALPFTFFGPHRGIDLGYVPHFQHHHFKNDAEKKLQYIETYYIFALEYLNHIKEDVLKVITDEKYFLESMSTLGKSE